MSRWRAEPMESVEGPRVLLVGPCDPAGGEFTFLSPPLGVWRLAGVLEARGFPASVFDPNCCDGPPEAALARLLAAQPWDIVGFSTTGMTLRFDLALAHLTRRLLPGALLIAGGMEATFNPESLLRLGPFEMVVLGEGEHPLLEAAARLRAGAALDGIPGTVVRRAGALQRHPQPAMGREELRDAIFLTPYERMPYRSYWRKLERAYRVGELPVKADREARLAEIRSVRLITLNYCPMGCSFCSSTNFLNDAQGGTARIARLDAGECLAMIERIVGAYPDVRTIIFQDDIFVFTADQRLLPLCEGIVEAKRRGRLPRGLQFISTNRIDSLTPQRLAAMRRAGFRVLGFGVENFSPRVLAEFNKGHIHPFIEPILTEALRLGITPFLDMILTSPRCGVEDLAETIRQGYRWTVAGCEAGMYPYVVPFSGAAMARDASLVPHTVHARHRVAGTAIAWDQPSKILPLDGVVREAILAIEADFDERLAFLETRVAHLPSRVRSLLWVVCAIPVLERLGCRAPDGEEVAEELFTRLPGLDPGERASVRRDFGVLGARRAVL
jgi:anaerobic magnesium-protoporphyrin IX monomethyl ester cyclase